MSRHVFKVLSTALGDYNLEISQNYCKKVLILQYRKLTRGLKKNKDLSKVAERKKELKDLQAKLAALLTLEAKLAPPTDLVEEIRRERERNERHV